MNLKVTNFLLGEAKFAIIMKPGSKVLFGRNTVKSKIWVSCIWLGIGILNWKYGNETNRIRKGKIKTKKKNKKEKKKREGLTPHAVPVVV